MIFFLSLSQLCQACPAYSTLTVPVSHDILPVHPTHVFHSLSWLCSTKSWFFYRLRSWASYTLSSYGTVNSINTIVFLFVTTTPCLDVNLWWLYATGTLVACSLQPAFASLAYCKHPSSRNLHLLSAFFLGLSDKANELWPLHTTDAALIRRSMPCARTSSTWLCRHVYLPSARAFMQVEHIC